MAWSESPRAHTGSRGVACRGPNCHGHDRKLDSEPLPGCATRPFHRTATIGATPRRWRSHGRYRWTGRLLVHTFAFRKSPKVSNNPCLRIRKLNAGLKGGWSYQAKYPTHPFLSLPTNQKLKHFDAVREMVVNLSLGSTLTSRWANLNDLNGRPIKRLALYRMEMIDAQARMLIFVQTVLLQSGD